MCLYLDSQKELFYQHFDDLKISLKIKKAQQNVLADFGNALKALDELKTQAFDKMNYMILEEEDDEGKEKEEEDEGGRMDEEDWKQ